MAARKTGPALFLRYPSGRRATTRTFRKLAAAKRAARTIAKRAGKSVWIEEFNGATRGFVAAPGAFSAAGRSPAARKRGSKKRTSKQGNKRTSRRRQ